MTYDIFKFYSKQSSKKKMNLNVRYSKINLIFFWNLMFNWKLNVNLLRKFQMYHKHWMLVILDSPYINTHSIFVTKSLLCERNRDPWFQRPVNLLANSKVFMSSLAPISLVLLFPMMHYTQLISGLVSAILDMHPAGNSKMSRFCSFSSFQRL